MICPFWKVEFRSHMPISFVSGMESLGKTFQSSIEFSVRHVYAENSLSCFMHSAAISKTPPPTGVTT
jgi:hypothetical protein